MMPASARMTAKLEILRLPSTRHKMSQCQVEGSCFQNDIGSPPVPLNAVFQRAFISIVSAHNIART